MNIDKIKVKVPMNEIAKSITVEAEIDLVGYKGWLVRLDIALLLIRLACFIAGFGYSEKETTV